MLKEILKIKKGSPSYLGQIEIDGKPFELPNGILNKMVTGCGATTLAIEDNCKTIVCSPRVKLLDNKSVQHKNTLLVKGGVNKTTIGKYIEETPIPKILVTYDSLYKVIDCIDDYSGWRVVVDEFQCILNDASFKADTEIKLLEKLNSFPYVTYLSATPILDKYLEQIEFFKDMPYIELDWEDKELVEVHRTQVNEPLVAAQNIVLSYMRGEYPVLPTPDGELVESKEAVIFLNSVTSIVNIIKNTKLKPEQVNIIVANNDDNDAIIKKLGEGYGNGTIPLKGEPHKLITMCTSTAYMGVDFYSECASTFVISDCTKINTSIDISTELSQIAGRQRLKTNPFRKHIFFYYNTMAGAYSEEEFEENIKNKCELSQLEVDFYNKAPEMLKTKFITDNIRNRQILGYLESYTMWNESTKQFEFNKLAQLSDRFAYDVQHYNYQNGVIVQKLLEESRKFDTSSAEAIETYKTTVAHSIRNTAFADRMKEYCEYRRAGGLCANVAAQSLYHKYPELKTYYDVLGEETIKELSYQESNLKDEYAFQIKRDDVQTRIDMRFKDGDRLSNVELKARIQCIYEEQGLNKRAKGADIKRFGYNTKAIKITLPSGERVNGVELKKVA